MEARLLTHERHENAYAENMIGSIGLMTAKRKMWSYLDSRSSRKRIARFSGRHLMYTHFYLPNDKVD